MVLLLLTPPPHLSLFSLSTARRCASAVLVWNGMYAPNVAASKRHRVPSPAHTATTLEVGSKATCTEGPGRAMATSATHFRGSRRSHRRTVPSSAADMHRSPLGSIARHVSLVCCCCDCKDDDEDEDDIPPLLEKLQMHCWVRSDK